MSKRFIIIFSVLIFSSLVGGFFLFTNKDIFQKNPFLASIIGSKKIVVLSDEDLASLKDKIIFLEKELKTKEYELEEIDDLLEENDLLNQRLIDLFWELEALQIAIFELENNQFQEEEFEEELGDELEEKDEEELETEELMEDAENSKNKESCVPGEININVASFEDLQKIVGVGSSYAQNIIRLRPFCSIDDLLKVSGIGQKTLQKIKEQGCAYVPAGVCPASIPVFVSSGGGSGGSSAPQPQILISFPPENPVNKEIEVDLSILNLKNTSYDVKIFIEKDDILADIYNEKTEKWQNSYNYIQQAFSGPSFQGKFKLKIKESQKDLRGEVDILARVRETGKSSYINYLGKINITEPEPEPIKEYNLTINILGQGATDPEAGIYLYEELKEVTVRAFVENEEWEFVGWTGDKESEENEISIVMDQNKIITANFQEKKDPEPESEPENLLKNPFFDEWTDNLPYKWGWTGASGNIVKILDPLVGSFSVELTPTTVSRNLNQLNVDMSSLRTYYARVWVKGTGTIEIGIKNPHNDNVDWGIPTLINNGDWIFIEHTRISPADGSGGGIRIRIAAGDPTNKIIIGAAWLGTTKPPNNWPN